MKVVVHEAQLFYNETIRLHDYYVDCVADAVKQCNATLIDQFEAERARTEAAAQHNQRTKQSSRQAQGSCASSHAMALSSLSLILIMTSILQPPFRILASSPPSPQPLSSCVWSPSSF